MSVNKYKAHVYILPEDDEDRELANGFVNNLFVQDQQVQVLPVAGGWASVLEKFQFEYIPHLKKYDLGYVVLLIDFDEQFESRFKIFSDAIPDEFKDRVFVIGVMDEPQDLKKALDHKLELEEIGSALADDCQNSTTKMWDHVHLKHNESERLRMLKAIRPILFASGGIA